MRTSNKYIVYEKWFILSDFDTNAENKNWSEDQKTLIDK